MLSRFMVIPHYTYLVLKMLAPHGVLTIYDDLIISFKCDTEALDIATTNACIDASAIMVAEAKKIASTDLIVSEQKRTETALDATPTTKKVCLGLADPAKTVFIGDTSGRNRNTRSPVSSWTMLTYSHGPHQICQVFQGSCLSTPWV
jgi:hypothetical protein